MTEDELFEKVFDEFELEFLLLLEFFIHHIIFSYLASQAGLLNLLMQNDINLEMFMEKLKKNMENLIAKTDNFVDEGMQKNKNAVKKRIKKYFKVFMTALNNPGQSQWKK